ncbi:hypothetical protein JL722_13567 [Aureococcus anophagefferens]|nr:hypothetical protein JL722_13567 [Aureococcus anophagefferens]
MGADVGKGSARAGMGMGWLVGAGSGTPDGRGLGAGIGTPVGLGSGALDGTGVGDGIGTPVGWLIGTADGRGVGGHRRPVGLLMGTDDGAGDGLAVDGAALGVRGSQSAASPSPVQTQPQYS